MTTALESPVYLFSQYGLNLGNILLSEAIQRVNDGEFEIVNSHQVKVKTSISQIISNMHLCHVIEWLLKFEIILPDNPYHNPNRQMLLCICLDDPLKAEQVIQGD